MSHRTISFAFACLLAAFFSINIYGQSFGANASAVSMSDCNENSFYNTTSTGANIIAPADHVFAGTNLGAYTQNSGTLILRGAEVRTFQTPGVSNVCNVRMYYRSYLATNTPGAFNIMEIPFLDDCDVPNSAYTSGGPCVEGDKKWRIVIADGVTTPYAPVDLTSKTAGNYILEVYFEITGSTTSTTACDETVLLNNGGDNYKASFSIQSPVLGSTNPTTCNGSEGSITISGLAAGATYSLSYMDDDAMVGPADHVANGAGQVILNGLNAGIYSSFSLLINGCTTELNTGLILSNPVFTPTFNKIASFCAGATPPALQTTSNNGVTGTWSPAVIDNQASGTYRFTPDPGQCGIPVNLNVVVNPILTPTFSFGTALTICGDASVPVLPTTSTNGKIGSWSPSAIDNQNSGTYTFTPATGQCATTTTLTVTVNPNITPTFSFGTSLSICADATAPALPTTSANNITGTWSPSTIDNQNSGTYTFTPTAGLCATTTTLTVTVSPNITPTFDFGTSLTFCADGTVPALPTTSENGITGTWNPAVVSNQASATYTFTPTAGLCATTATFTVTVAPNITPTFDFGTSLTICADGAVPTLPTTSVNSITGTWNAATVDNQNSATYTFTPTAGQCATNATFSVTVNPNITPTFSFGTALTICADATAPALPTTSANNITGTWSPSTIDNQNSGTYTFTPTAGLCATTTTLTVTVSPNITPTFDFGTSLTICADGAVPALPTSSENGITGSWSPAFVSNQASATYTFTPTAGLCATTATFAVTVAPNITPTFDFGTSLTICANGAVPTLPTTSVNSITGTWNAATVDNQNSATYTFTPTAGQCATNATFSVTVNPNITPTFSFGTALTICADATAPALPTTSANNITGTWSPSTIDNQNSGTYTFTPTAGLCATTTTLTVTVNPNITPTFDFGTAISICAGDDAIPNLKPSSTNGINGTWNPSEVSNTTSGVYTFTPAAGQCATPITFTVTVNNNEVPTFDFGTALTICSGETVPVLPGTSENNITGTWYPIEISNTVSDTYTFLPAEGICATMTTLSVTVNPNITPTFSFGTAQTICADAAAPVLPTTSSNNITGTWNPAVVNNQVSGTYTFTPGAGQCATTAEFTVTVNPNEIPTFSFGTSLTICAGETVPALPSSSENGISGTWSPAAVDNQISATYTFTPGGGCASPTTFNVTVTPNVIPTFDFGTSLTICADGTVPTLPNTSDNGISGTWNPAVVSNQASGTYTFTPSAGICATTAIFTVTVNPNQLPTFDFGTALTLCAEATAPALPTTSTNNITGTWTPSMIDNENSGTYTFTPTAGLCATVTTLTVTISPNQTPVFSFGSSLTICAGETVPALPTTSDNGISGTWNPSSIDNQNSGIYTFTPAAGVCATTATFTVTVTPNITPTFTFGTSLTICAEDFVPALPSTSDNGITGTWNPTEINKQASGVYTFTPTAGVCATTATFTVTVNQNVLPLFDFGTSMTVCSDSTVPELPTASTNGIIGAWSPATIDNQASGTYTFTPVAGSCGTMTSLTVTVTPSIAPTFDLEPTLSICTGGDVPVLPAKSTNDIEGTWEPAIVDNQASGVYTFTPDATPEQCIGKFTLTVTVNPILNPTFDFGTSLSLCRGTSAPLLPSTSANGIEGTWSPAAISNQVSGTYTFTTTPGQCATEEATLVVTVNEIPTVNQVSNNTVNDGMTVPANNLTGTPTNVIYNWTNSNPAIGLVASGNGNIPSFTATNQGNAPISGTITVTPMNNGCAGTSLNYVVTVNPLDKDVFVPNVFTPNADGKNDILYVYSNYITELEMRIFNQYGQEIHMINNVSRGWDGTHRGKQQPVGVYVYTLRAVLTDGRIIKSKGSITLLR